MEVFEIEKSVVVIDQDRDDCGVLLGHHARNQTATGREGDGVQVYDPHAEGIGGDLISAVLGIIKGMVGPAILYLPHGFARAGYVPALPIMACTTCMYLYSSSCLLAAWRIEAAKNYNGAGEYEPVSVTPEGTNITNDGIMTEGPLESHAVHPNTSSVLPMHAQQQEPMTQLPPQYPQPVQQQQQQQQQHHHQQQKQQSLSTPLSYPELARRTLGPSGETAVKCGIALMQSGVCLTYLIFVPHNLSVSLNNLFGMNAPARSWLVVMVLIQIPLSWIRNIRLFTTTNFVANVLILYGLITCLGFAVEEASAAHPEKGHVGSFVAQLGQMSPFQPSWFLFIGTSVLLFEGSITLLIPLQEAVDKPEERQQFPQVYKRVILAIIGFYLFFGLSCWASFGDDVTTVLTTSLPTGMFATSVQLAYSIAVIFTFPLQNFPALEIACKTLTKSLVSTGLVSRTSWLVRRDVLSSVLVCILALVAVTTMDALDKVVSLMGALLGCPIAFVFPPLIYDKLCSEPDSSPVRYWNKAVALMGILAMLFASAVTIVEW